VCACGETRLNLECVFRHQKGASGDTDVDDAAAADDDDRDNNDDEKEDKREEEHEDD